MSAMMSPLGRVADMLFNHLAEAELLGQHFLVIELFDKEERIIHYTKLSAPDGSELYYQILKRVTFVNESLITTEAL